jgi:hypothetical protein
MTRRLPYGHLSVYALMCGLSSGQRGFLAPHQDPPGRERAPLKVEGNLASC